MPVSRHQESGKKTLQFAKAALSRWTQLSAALRIQYNYKMRFNNLERYRVGGTDSRMQLAIPIPQTPDGRQYRFSPNPDAHPRHFVLGGVVNGFQVGEDARARMKLVPRSQQSVCPYSGVIADDESFIHPEDRDAAIEIMKHAAAKDVVAAFTDMFKGLQKHPNLTIKTSKDAAPTPRPHFFRQDLLRELICDHCGRDYGVYAIALFCPDCGAPNLRLHFEREAALVAAQVDLAEAQHDPQGELSYRLLGNAHEDVLTAFEATLKTVYLHGMAEKHLAIDKPVRNDFQNLENAQRRYAQLNLDPFDCLDVAETEVLKLNIQKRHVIGHNLGVVDAKFASYALDAQIGQTIKLLATDIRTFSLIAQKIIDRLDAWLAGGTVSPFIGSGEVLVLPANAIEPLSPLENAAKRLKLSILATKIAYWLVRENQNGLCHEFSNTTKLASNFSEEGVKALAEAIAELSMDGFVISVPTMSEHLPHIRPTVDLFAVFDPIAEIGNPQADAVALVTLLEASDDAVNVATLHKSTTWPSRRFNPALAIVLSKIGQQRISQVIIDEYPCPYFFLASEDRVALRRFAATMTGK